MKAGTSLPASLACNRQLADWIEFDTVRRMIILRVGKVEIGQGIGTALVQIAAEELGLPPSSFQLVAGRTDASPDELWTSASISVEVGGAAVRLVAAEVRDLFTREAGRRLGVAPADVDNAKGTFRALSGDSAALSYWDLSPQVDLHREYEGCGALRSPSGYQVVGTSLPRLDLDEKLRGRGFIHDIRLPGMLHGRVLRPPRASCRLEWVDRAALAGLPGIALVLVDGRFVAVCAEREYDAIRAQTKGQEYLRWSGGESLPVAESLESFVRGLEKNTIAVHIAGDEALLPAGAVTLRTSYLRPYLAHASVGTCCALAQPDSGGYTVYSHSQGVFPLRAALAEVLGLPRQAVTVIHRDGAGCYGHNGADDVALEAVLLAREAGCPVRVAWSRQEELSSAPFGPGMLVELAASVAPDGRILRWRHDVHSTTHLVRPGWGQGVNLLAAALLEPPFEHTPITDPPQHPYGGAGDRNAIPLYDFARCEVNYLFSAQTPLRTSALRSLGAHANVFAIESMLDELAAAVGSNPLAIRRGHLRDRRALATLDAAVALAGWTPEREGTGEWGWGLAFGQYKNRAAYFAAVVEVSITHQVRVTRVSAAVDCGLAVNPDGVLNQIEGGIVQAISWTLKEQVTWTAEGIESCGWEQYPILGFDEVPEIRVRMLSEAEDTPLGVGECTMGPIAGAIGNAIHHALGVRVREMPLSFDRIVAAA